MGTLKIAKNKGTIEMELKKLEKTQLLILDDLFLVPLDAKERAHLTEIIEFRKSFCGIYHKHLFRFGTIGF